MLLSRYAIKFEHSLPWRVLAFTFDTLFEPIRWFSRKRKGKPERILVIRKDEIGDNIMALPIYEAIKKAYPEAKLTVMIGKPSAPLLEKNPYVDEVIPIETIRNNKSAFISQYFALIRQLKKKNFDVAIDPKGSILNIIMMYLIGAKSRVSYWNVSGGRPLLTHPMYYAEEIHDTKAGLNLLKAIGIKAKQQIPKIYLTSREIAQADKIIKKLPKNYICTYMTPTKVYKGWPIAHWNSLFSMFPNRNFVIIARESEKNAFENSFARNKNVSFLCLDSIKLLSAVLGKAKAIVAVDGGMMHLALISNPRVVTLFGQVDLAILKPFRGTVICHFPESKQGLNRMTIEEGKPNKYIEIISPEEVASALRSYLK